ncbi:hydrogenase expression/formation protein [Ancylobacter lacus]|uniref:hydrogenase expression/formation protein n=1 Tax=Ancylobacter lacus TaxID=2579970 RepID=UPI001BCDE16B|nr:hydrogenase expression/formation protein [Ancylobacter lacus]MBS7537526.1 hydrogenase expression/formation protein [Ancylobacter lacus]
MSSIPFATMPPIGYGPGSQPDDGVDGLAYLPMPSGMRVFEAHLPEIEDPARVAAALATLEDVRAALAGWMAGGSTTVSVGHLDPANRALVDETLGEGEVAIVVEAPGERIEIQEATCAGVWRVRAITAGAGKEPAVRERIEVAAFPRGALLRAFPREWPVDLDPASLARPGVVNAPAILTEIVHKSREHGADRMPHVVNLSLLPHTPEDLALIESCLGRGGITILSRGYGNCRIEATATARVWRVRYYNSADTLILDTFEVTEVPEVACAAAEDIADSAARLADILAALR